MQRTVTLALGSVAIGFAVLGLKFTAYAITGSVALFSDALESIINIAAATAAVVAVHYSSIPADANHPYGHNKAEYFSSVLEGVLIVIAALLILREAYFGFFAPKPIDAPMAGLAVNGLATLVNAMWSVILTRSGRRLRSPALIADGQHLRTDVVTSGGVLVGVLLVTLTGWLVLDPILAAIVAVHILWSGWGLVRESVSGLMDEAVPPGLLDLIRKVISANAGGAIEAHDLRTRHSGSITFIEFHLVVDGGMRVADAHDICDRIETALKADVEGSVVTIHVEPEVKAKHSGVLVL